MKAGDLVRITEVNCHDLYDKVGIIADTQCNGFLVAVYFPNGEGFWLLPASLEVISESR